MKFSQHFLRLTGGWLLSLAAATELPTATPQNLVRQLGHPEFQRRIDAERELLLLGTQSLPAVGQGTQSADPEIRIRAQRLLQFLQRNKFWEQEAAILENPWTAAADVAPAWEEYHALVGDSLTARELYVQILKQETDLMLAVDRDPAGWPLVYERRCADLQAFFTRRSDRSVSPTTTACLLFLAAHPDNSPSSSAISVVNLLIGDTQFVHAVEHEPTGPALRSLLTHWIGDARNATPQMRLSLAARFNLPVGIEPARVLIQSRHAAGQSRTQLQNAVLYLARHGGTDVIEELEALLDDETSLWPSRGRNGNQKDLQVRDVALLGLLVVTGQRPELYGFDGLRQDASYVYAPNSSSFPNNEVRDAALLRWHEWKRKNLRAVHTYEDASEWVPL